VAKINKHIKAPHPTHEQIATRAYEIYLANGCQEGHAQDDWLQAQYELLQQPVRKLAGDSPRTPASVALLAGVVHGAFTLVQMSH